jgi:hypothetical protein
MEITQFSAAAEGANSRGLRGASGPGETGPWEAASGADMTLPIAVIRP